APVLAQSHFGGGQGFPVTPQGNLQTASLNSLGSLPSPYSTPPNTVQLSIGVSGTLFVPITPIDAPSVGVGGGAALGMSTDGTILGTSFFGQVQANGMIGVGAYAGIGLLPGGAYSQGAPQRGVSTSTTGYFE